MNNPPTESSTSGHSSTTGRRHVRAGSVHVTELINKRAAEHPPSRPESPAGPREHGDTLDATTGPSNHRPSSHRRAPTRSANLAKIVGVGVASLVLCVSVALASMISQRREGTDAVRDPPPDLQITGARALLPDELTHIAPLVTGTAIPDLPDPMTSPTTSAANSGTSAEPPKPVDSAQPDPTGNDGAGETAKTELVEQFYQVVLAEPDKAFRLLDTRLPGRDLSTFVQSWDNVAELEVLDVRERSIDVLAVIRLRLTDGSHLHVRQSLEVSDAEPRRIVGARVLAAQRMAK